MILFCLLTFIGMGLFAYTTPDTGVTWSMDDLVANSGGAVTVGTGPYTLTEDLDISETDTITVAAGDRIAITAGFGIYVYGRLDAVGTAVSGITFTSASGAPAVADWYAIYVEEAGSVNLSYCTIEYGEYGVYLSSCGADPGVTGVPSIIDNCTFDHSAPLGNYSIYVEYYAAPTLTITNNTIDGTDSDYGIYLYYIGLPTIVTISGNTITDCSGFAMYLEWGGDNTVIDNNTLTDNGYGIYIYEGFWQSEITNNTITNCADYAITLNDDDGGGEGSLIKGNTIDTADYGIYIYNTVGVTVTDNIISNCTSEAIYLDSYAVGCMITNNTLDQNSAGIYATDSWPVRKAGTAAYQWIEVNEDNADAWNRDVDDGNSTEALIGFDFPLDGEIYQSHEMCSNANMQLGHTLGDTNGNTNYQGRGYFIDHYNSSTYIFIHADDYDDDGIDPYETHDGSSVQMDGWGWKHFSASDTDGDGSIVPEECTVFTWYTCRYDEFSPEPWNAFQVVLYPDGRIRWNTRFQDQIISEYGDYSGIYAGANAEPFEVTASYGEEGQSSFFYDPSNYIEASTVISNNTLTQTTNEAIYLQNQVDTTVEKNSVTDGTDGIYLDSSTDCTVFDNTVSDCTSSGMYLGNADDNSVTYNVLDANAIGLTLDSSDSNTVQYNTVTNSTAQGIVLDTTNGNTIDGNTSTGNDVGLSIANSTSDTISNNNLNDNTTWLLQNTTAGAVDAADNYWGDTLADAAAIDAVIEDDEENGALGAITFEPYLGRASVPPAKPGTKKKSSSSGRCGFGAAGSEGFTMAFMALAMLGLALRMKRK